MIEENLQKELAQIEKEHREKSAEKPPEVEAREQLAEELRLLALSDFDREKEQLRLEMQERLKVAGEDKDLRLQIEAEYNKNLKKLQEEADEESMRAREEYFKLLRTDEQNELLELDKYYSELIRLAQENGDSTVELERLYAEQKKEVRENYRARP